MERKRYICRMKSQANKSSLILDLFFCVGFMPLLIVLGPAHSWATEMPLFFAITCLFFYGCYFAVTRLRFPNLLISRDYKRIAIVLSALIAGNCILTLYPLPAVDFVTPVLSEYQTRVRNYNVALGLWLMFSMVVSYALSVSFARELFRQELLKRKIEHQRDKAELAMFKAQISPHFLFNTLNSLYSLVIGTSQKAEDAFIKFTDILKYTYTTIGNETVPIREEISYIGNYIDLQELRLNGHTRVEWHSCTDDPDAPIPPMLMLTFVENAFKYGSSASSDCTISINLTLQGGQLTFETRNSIMRHADEFRTDMPVGIENCRARLAAVFPGRHTLETSETDGTFTLSLKINML